MTAVLSVLLLVVDLVTDLVSPHFDEARYIANAVASSLGSSSTTLDRLQSLMREIDEQIHHQVVSHHQPLLTQTAELAPIETKLQLVATKYVFIS
jgi:thymidine phosphorylase